MLLGCNNFNYTTCDKIVLAFIFSEKNCYHFHHIKNQNENCVKLAKLQIIVYLGSSLERLMLIAGFFVQVFAKAIMMFFKLEGHFFLVFYFI